MAYISEAKHRELDNLLCQFLKQNEHTDLLRLDTEFLKKDRHELHGMFTQYQDHIVELMQLIRKYHDLHRKTRVQLRRLQLSNKQQSIGETTTVRRS